MSNINLTIIDTDKDFQILDIFLDDDGIAEIKDLETLSLPEGFNYKKGIVLFGRAPIWLYAYLTHLCHPFVYVAVYDPRIGGGVVVENHLPDAPQIASVIPDEYINEAIERHKVKKGLKKRQEKNSKIIAFVGPPHSGKSILLYQINTQLMKFVDNEFFQRNYYAIRACPDGEGNWSNEIDNDKVEILRYKNAFDDKFVEKITDHLDNLIKNKKLILVDCGGKIDSYNQQIWNYCTDAIIVSSDKNKIPEWRGAVKASELNIIAEINTSLDERLHIEESNDKLYLEIGPVSKEKKIDIPQVLMERIVPKTK